IREDKGKSGDAVAAALKWSPSKISRYERARTGLRPREVERLLDYYQITGSHRELLLRLAEDATQKGWWEEFTDSLSEDYKQFIGLEHEAASMSIWHVDVVPGLLQTEDYARHIISSYSRVEPIPPAMIERLVRVRMRRQQVLNHDGLQLSVVLDESVLKRRIGDDTGMYDQLRRLAREAERPNLTLQILPLNARHVIFGESFAIFGFGYDSEAMMQDVVITEQLRNSFILEGERETYLHRIAFQMLADASLDPVKSRELILDTAESCWSGARRPAHVSPPGGPPGRQVVAQPPLAGGEHHPARPRPARALVAGQARDRVGGFRGERRGQNRAVLDRLAGSLPEVREHRMRGVAQDGDPAARPPRDRVAIVKRPLVPGARGGEQAEQGLVPAGITLEHLLAAALRDPRLVPVAGIVVVADNVDQFLAPQRVQHDRAVRAEPLGPVGGRTDAADGFGPDDAAIADLPGEPGVVRAEQAGAHR